MTDNETGTENSLLSKIRLPGKRFRLPSRGLFYTDGELDGDVVDGEVEVFSMTSIDEITLRSPEFLFDGTAIDRVFKRCVPQILKPLRLLGKDVDYILACLRIVSYGGSYQVHTRCPVCENKQHTRNTLKRAEFFDEIRQKAEDQDLTLEEALLSDQVQAKIAVIDAKQSDEQTYVIDLGGIVQNNTVEMAEDELAKYQLTLSNGQKLQITPMKMDSAVATYQFQNQTNSLDLTVLEEFISFMIASTILSVDDVTDWDMICEWANKLPLSLKREIEERSKEFIVWGTDFTYNVKCQSDDCTHERNISTLLNPITFFMIPSE